MTDYLNNLSIRCKLYGLTLFPLLGFICFSSYNFIETYRDKIVLEEMLVLTNSASISATLVHELQKERGLSAGYLASKGDKFSTQVPKQRLNTDQNKQQLNDFIQEQDLPDDLKQLFNKVAVDLNKLPAIRLSIDSFNISVKEEVAFYSNLNKNLLSIMDNTANKNKETKLALSAVAIGSFLQHKERAGIERAILSNVFALNKFTPVLLEKFIRLLAEEEAYLIKFKAHANTTELGIYQKIVKGKVISDVNDYRQIALDNIEQGNFNVDPTVWFATMSKNINLLKEVETSLLDSIRTNNEALISEKQNTLTLLAIITFIPLFFTLFVSYLIAAKLLVGINEITNKLHNISQTDDLTIRVNVKSTDELGDISTSINSLVSHLQDIVQKIQMTSSSLKETLNENEQNSEVISQKIIVGSDQVTQIATATTEMSSTVADIARNAIDASSETERATQESVQSQVEISETTVSINQLSHDLNQASSVISELNQSSENIGKFINVIKEISEKTNLLALNAAIEAARAGESGRGFAVVADEVRSLASQTKKSTSEIELMVAELQSKSNSAQKAMKNGIKMVNKSVQDTTHTGENIERINKSIEQVNMMNEQVATAAEEQSCVTEEINRNMVNIQEGYADMQTSYEQINSSTQKGGKLANDLNEIVRKFKI